MEKSKEEFDVEAVARDVSLKGDSHHVSQADAIEHQLTFTQALKLYPAAIGWSAFFSLGIIMAAFDPQLLGSLYATPAFQKDFGYLFEDGYIISAPWQTGLGMGSPIGQVVGALAAGYPMEWYGRKPTFIACVILTAACIFLQFFARSLPVLLAGELLGGLVLGCYTTIAPTYASEVCPVALRGHLTAYINLCFVTGQLLANGVIAGTSRLSSHWAYSAPFALQWLWPAVILAGSPFAPESPWWYIRQGRLEDAEKSLKRLGGKGVDVKASLRAMVETDRLEVEMETGSSYWDCFKGTNLRRTEISVGVFATQVLSGIYIVGYAAYFFQLAGLTGSKAFDMSVGFLAVGWLGTVLSWILILHIGRRRIYNIGLSILAIIMFLIAFLDFAPDYETRPSIIWAQSTLLIIWNGVWDITIGPICYIIICEASATRLRTKTVAVATASQALVGVVMTVAIPYMINPDQADLRGKMGLFFGGLSLVCFVWAWLRIPETKGRTFKELDLMFDERVSTRDFKDYKFRE
ncbi:MFS sugar transporter-like protein [Amylocarpus encephaloides]|uniref:MFS sugar transporter-like protein n=1 Tax=Amylocarpus encephaloides TaxID=45428 RepID=A0A9P7YPJ2_9HELO|nr:MFS sugar transporter-like protein [Amylocarpus encephaloides]